MFQTTITTTPFEDVGVFENISQYSYSDISMLSTIKALLCDRIKPDEYLFIGKHPFSPTVDAGCCKFLDDCMSENKSTNALLKGVADYTIEDCGCWNLNGDNEKHSEIRIIEVRGTTATKEQCETFINNAKEFMSHASRGNWEYIEKISVFFKKTMPVSCFVDKEKRRTVIFIPSIDMRKYHYLQCGMFAYLPWYFDTADNKPDQYCVDLIYSLRETTETKYLEAINKIANEKINLREIKIKAALDGFQDFELTNKLESLERNINDIERRIDDALNNLSGLYERRREAHIQHSGTLLALNNSENKENELMDYFLANKNLDIINRNGSSIRFMASGFLEHFDEDGVETLINNEDSYLYKQDGRRLNEYIPKDDMKMLLTEIFINRTLKIKLCAEYYLDISRIDARGTAHSPYYTGHIDCMPNPHIDIHGCLGGHARELINLLEKGDIVAACEQTLSSVMSINVMESPTMCPFIKRLYGVDTSINRKCIHLPDGRVVLPEDAIKYLKGELDNEQTD